MPQRPLEGLRVLELARVLAGPWIGQTLADLGADVIKVESPEGDETRGWGPPFAEDGAAAYFHAANRNKRSIRIDFRDPAERAQAQTLAPARRRGAGELQGRRAREVRPRLCRRSPPTTRAWSTAR